MDFGTAMERSPNVPVRSVETTLSLLGQLQEWDGAGVSELASELDIAKSTVHNHLRTLERHEYVVREDDEFRLSFRFLDLGNHVRVREQEFDLVQPKVREIANETGETCQFFVREFDRAVIVFMEHGEQAVKTKTRVGTRIQLDQLAAGRVLAAMEEGENDKGDDSDSATLATDGYLVTDEAYIKGLHAIAVPITKTDDEVVGALSVAGPAHRLRNEEYEHDIANHLLNVSNELELNVSYSRY